MSSDIRHSKLMGQILGDQYCIKRKIAEGGMGVVFEAEHVRLTKKRFAVKILHPSIKEDKEVYVRFRREAEIATELGHRNIVDVLDFNETEDGQPYMVMEYLEGEDLAGVYAREGRLSHDQVIGIMECVASALGAAHAKGIVHRDMKPENIFVARDSEGDILIKVLDFGISKIKHSKSVVTQDHSVMGTPFYMSPEQAIGNVKEIDHRTDIFALGTICYQALAGKVPFDAPTLPGVIYKICHEPHPKIAEQVEDLPQEVEEVLNRALAKDMDDRYNSAEQFVADLKTALSGEEATDTPLKRVPSISSSDLLGDSRREDISRAPTTLSMSATEVPIDGLIPQRKGPLLVAALGAVVLAAGIAYWAMQDSSPQVSGTSLAKTSASRSVTGSNPVPEPVKATLKEEPPAAARPQPAPAKAPAQPLAKVSAKKGGEPTKGDSSEFAHITLKLTPPSAQWTLDGKTGKGKAVRLKRSAVAHKLLVKAAGYRSKEKIFVADRDNSITVRLRKSRRRKPGARGQRPAPRVDSKAVPKVPTKTRPVGEGTMDWR